MSNVHESIALALRPRLCALPHEVQVDSPNSRQRWTASTTTKSQSQNFQREFGTCQTLAYNPNSRHPQYKIRAFARRFFSFPVQRFEAKRSGLQSRLLMPFGRHGEHNAESARICHAATGSRSAQSGRHGTRGTRRSARTSARSTRKSRIWTSTMAPHGHRRFHRQSFQAFFVASTRSRTRGAAHGRVRFTSSRTSHQVNSAGTQRRIDCGTPAQRLCALIQKEARPCALRIGAGIRPIAAITLRDRRLESAETLPR